MVKCRIQVDPGKYGGIVNGFKISVKEGGAKELTKGWAPTLIGYSMQGLCKFGFYEVFKIVYGNMLGEVIHLCNVLNIIFETLEHELKSVLYVLMSKKKPFLVKLC